MVEKKKSTPSQRGSPIQEVSPRRRTESPSRRSPRQTNSPQAGNEGDFGNNNVSPNDQDFENDNEDVTGQFAQPDFDSLDPYSVLECLTNACKALSLANAKGKGTNELVIRSLD